MSRSRLIVRMTSSMVLLAALTVSVHAAEAMKIYESTLNDVATLTSPVYIAETVKIYESTFNDFSTAILPVTVRGHYKFQVTVDLGWFGRHKITLCDSDYTATVSTLDFDIDSTGVDASGKVSASWCSVSFPDSRLDASGNITYSATDSTVRSQFTSASVRPCRNFNFIGMSFTICLPANINIAPTLNIPPVQIGYAQIGYETAASPRSLIMRPGNTTLSMRNGYLELQTYVSFH